jgi:hypothetical protein
MLALRTLESESELESVISGSEVYGHRKSREIGKSKKIRVNTLRASIHSPYWLAGATTGPWRRPPDRTTPILTFEDMASEVASTVALNWYGLHSLETLSLCLRCVVRALRLAGLSGDLFMSLHGCWRSRPFCSAIQMSEPIDADSTRLGCLKNAATTVKGSGRGERRQQRQPTVGEEGDPAVRASVYGKVQAKPDVTPNDQEIRKERKEMLVPCLSWAVSAYVGYVPSVSVCLG